MRDDSSVKLRVGAIVAIVLYLTWVWQGSSLCINLSGTSDPSGLKLTDLSNLKIDGSSATSDLLLSVLDLVSLLICTAIRTDLDTCSLVITFCVNSPSKLLLLLTPALASNVPREMRAQYLVNALALTTVMILLAGKDGFAPKF